MGTLRLKDRLSELTFALLVFTGLVVMEGCSSEKSNPTLPDTHPDTWLNINSPDFHGKVALNSGVQSCIECHGSDWNGGKSKVSCIDCHSNVAERCTRCHGGVDDNSGAPPLGLRGQSADSTLGVGAHRSHLQNSALAAILDCENCHLVPVFVLDDSHFDTYLGSITAGTDSIAEIVWHGLASRGGAANWNRGTRTCSNVYCHGNFSGGKTVNAPVWTGDNQAACGTCHDVGTNPATLLWKHEFHVKTAGLKCVECHSDVVNSELQIVGKELHVDGLVDTLTRDPQVCNVCHGSGSGSCTSCHGGLDNETGAPPKGLRGETQRTQRAVGAHSTHVQPGPLAEIIDCSQCHVVPAQIAAAGHLGADSLAEVTFGGLAGGSANWDRSSQSCSGVYCHGNFSAGRRSNSPVWTATNQAACGTCHDVGNSPADLLWKHELHISLFGLNCADCHANVVNSQLQIVGRALHVNGQADTLTRDPALCNVCHGAGEGSCVTCHGGGDNQSGAPPKGLHGETSPTLVSVGAHTAHIEGGALVQSVACNQCHHVPAQVAAAGHLGADSLAEMNWGNLAGAASSWNRATQSCTNTYCHGNFAGGKRTNAPQWTGSSQAACGSCHDVGDNPANLLWEHELHVTSFGLACADCHANVVDQELAITGKDLHVNGAVDTLTRDIAICNLCHGPGEGSCITCHGGSENQTGAPPKGLRGETSFTDLAVGAHSAHVNADSIASPVACNECHVKPTLVTDTGHIGLDSLAEITWGNLAGGSSQWNHGNGTCTNTYCHGNFSGGKRTNAPVWNAANQAFCGSCHDVGNKPSDLLWKHDLHITAYGLQCADCHANVVDSQLKVTGKSLHVNGVIDTLTRDPQICNSCHGPEPSCTRCHGGTDNQTGAPPTGLRGETLATQIAVGAHSAHVGIGAIAASYDCTQCHTKPTKMTDSGHLGADSLAEVVWGGIAGASSRWSRSSRTCASTYCHGNFTGGNVANTPVWTGSNQATCGSCHDVGNNPSSLLWKHELHINSFGLKCANCHAGVTNLALEITNKSLHVNGTVDTLTSDPALCNPCHGPGQGSCTSCHGGVDNLTGAPPKGLRGEMQVAQIAVGAHSAHVENGSQANGFDCVQCHIKPSDFTSPGHYGLDSLAEVTWGGIAGATSNWNRSSKTCSNTYCHGNFSGGEVSNVPVWTDTNQANCGSCHDVGTNPASLLWKHDLHVTTYGFACRDCHYGVVDSSLQIIAKNLHVNGIVDTLTRDTALCNTCHGPGGGSCTSCHGGTDNQTGAPPKGLRGESLIGQIAVGAHTAHSESGPLADAYDCDQCHVKPNNLSAPGHLGADSLAEITWGGIAGASSQWNRVTENCVNTYCHGNFPGGTATNTPLWTGTNQATCGTCHDVGSNPATLLWKHEVHVSAFGLRCNDCHASVVDSTLQITGKSLHVNGVVDTLTRDQAVCNTCHGPGQGSCTSCHGGNDNPTGAPPKGLRGETATTAIAVGAHSQHVQTGAIADAFDCSPCHVRPASLLSSGHLGPDSLAEITWGDIAGASSQWNRTARTCTNTYCHGNFTGGATTNTPVWTGANQAACGSCHDVGSNPSSLQWKHAVHATWGLQCNDCHSNVVNSSLQIIDKVRHVNGTIDTLTRDSNLCNRCHGTGPDRCTVCHGGIDNQTGAPPKGLHGETATSAIAVGAHTGHVEISDIANAFDCNLCHTKPATVIAPGHLAVDSLAEITWHGISGTSGVWNRTSKTCASTYCHGNFPGGKTANAPVWTGTGQATCGSCHDVGTSPSSLGGEHDKHVRDEGFPCQRCHASTVSTTLTITGKALHINGANNVNFFPNTGSYSNGTCSNPAGCHGNEHW